MTKNEWIEARLELLKETGVELERVAHERVKIEYLFHQAAQDGNNRALVELNDELQQANHLYARCQGLAYDEDFEAYMDDLEAESWVELVCELSAILREQAHELEKLWRKP